MTRLSLSVTLLAALSAATTAFAESEICPTMYADFQRRQLKNFNFTEPFPNEIDGSAKHIPVLTLSEDGTFGTVVVGNGDEVNGVWHPMVASEDPSEVHFITHILVQDQDDNVVALESMDPTVAAPAKMTFSVPAGVTELTPYNWCNKHGLWKGELVTVTATSAGRSSAACGVSEFQKSAWTSVHADFMRMQKEHFESQLPFTEADGAKHTPYITLKDDGTASVLVGDTDVAIHPMNGSPDGESKPHWITEIYIMDQSGTIVAMKSLDSAGVNEATMDFKVPEGAESLQAYEWCNLHGLWEGPVVKIESMSSVKQNSGVAPSISVGAVVGASLLTALNM
eukprot:CAMPEP_0201868152 /NCGR_PEP_ID=MMETSP0902-20130614/2160_1 /ASSEMBLY_ACC=CAM_ASM_000551 /TAXON_ID=420261 /ORGANISM="Thalassiosira antarctica, Strain CCMP982" /LENGTH=338 /DNA_ID=CAMNT_0048393463 /DNA_START=90 /DNA_END=1106 /DNA_ORIENTATION=+